MQEQIIKSLLDTDLYKFTMQQVALRQFSDVWVKYVFKSRKELIWTPEMLQELNSQIDAYCELRFQQDELQYLANLRFMKRDYIEFLKLFKPLREHVKASLEGTELSISIEGPWYQTIMWEIPLLAMVSEVYYRTKFNPFSIHMELAERNLDDKIRQLREIQDTKSATYRGFAFSEFGTRRRCSFEWQSRSIEVMKHYIPKMLAGTSNVLLAKNHKLLAIGTNAHEFYQVGQALSGVQLVESQKHMLQSWVNEYRGDLGIALTDTLGSDKFVQDFDLYFAKLYDGVRHDSGDPMVWAEKMIGMYDALGVDAKTKTLLFTDSLNFDKALKIYQAWNPFAKIAFGIGTFISNDLSPAVDPLNIVIKLDEVNGRPTAKLSDDAGKEICKDFDFLCYLKTIAGRRVKITAREGFKQER